MSLAPAFLAPKPVTAPKGKSMSRKFIALVLAISTSIAGFTAAPARAMTEEEVARFLGTAAAVFIIGKAIQQSRDSDRDDKKWRPRAEHHKPVPKVIDRGFRDRDFRDRHRAAAIPARCVRQINTGNVRRVVLRRCLERNYSSARALPKACRMTVRTNRGKEKAYALPCLRQRGYTLARN
jgi:hypothetical protein